MRNHAKVKVLRAEFGRDGYCFWSFILEYLGSRPMLRCSCDPFELKLVAGDIGFDLPTFTRILEECFSLKLLAKDDEGYFYSPSLTEEMAPLFIKRDRDKQEKREKRGSDPDLELTFNEIEEQDGPPHVAATNAVSAPTKPKSLATNDRLDKTRLEENILNTLSTVEESTRAREAERERVLNEELGSFRSQLSARHREFDAAWDSWLSHLDRIGVDVYPEKLIEHLRTLSNEPNPVAAIRIGIAEGWKAIFPVKPEQYQAARVPGLIVKPKPREIQEPVRVASMETVRSLASAAKNLIRGGPQHEPAT